MTGRRLFSSRRQTRTTGPWRLWATGLGLAVVLWLIGLVAFVNALPGGPPDPLPKADGIVALTGGAERLVVAMSLLTDGKADRLLITGVNPATTREDLKRLVSDPALRFDCCVDLDRAAQNTIGNALETKRWAASHGYRSLIIVTGQYHMPRSLRELAFVMPDVTLSGYPVFPSTVRLGAWWRDADTFELLVAEYTKYLMSSVRIRLTKLLTPSH